ncbi:MAG: LptF/LptG family permease [Chlamydiales bacterium]|nr:LptF/LptG family permease [Chlamydiales bacterium]
MFIWRRYLLLRLILSFLFILLSLFLLFIFIDLSVRSGKIFGKHGSGSYETIFYYCCQLSNYLHFFFPLSFLLASTQVLLNLNSHHELVAFQMGGLSKRKLLSPFFLVASCLFGLSIINQEWIIPKTLASAYDYTKAHARHKKKPLRDHLQTIHLEDGSEMVFQSIDEQTKELFDVFWLQDSSTIWYMKFLHIKPPLGRFVERFERKNHLWGKTDCFDSLSFPQLSIDEKQAFNSFTPYERRPLSELVLQAYLSIQERPKLLAHLFYKLSSSLMIFLLILAIAPACFSFSRTRSSFLIIALFLFGFLASIMLLDGLLILGENQVIHANIAFGVPLTVLAACCYRYFRKNTIL